MSYKEDRRCSYKLADFMKYRDVNNIMPKNLLSYCIKQQSHTITNHDGTTAYGYGNNIPDISTFLDSVNDTINIITQGDNPNDVMFRNNVKTYINALSDANYDEYVKKFSQMVYSSKANIHFLTIELISCAIRCPISYKGFNLQEEKNHKTVPEVCADLTKFISTLPIVIDGVELNLRSEILLICHQYFVNFMNPKKLMDENNAHNADNYKGFMTLMGLLYARNLTPSTVLLDCIKTIKNCMFISKGECNGKNISSRNNVECSNLYKGYEHLINHIVHTLQKKLPDMMNTLKTEQVFLDKIGKSLTAPNLSMNKFIQSNEMLVDDLVLNKTLSDIIGDACDISMFSDNDLDRIFYNFQEFYNYLQLNTSPTNLQKISSELFNIKQNQLKQSCELIKANVIKLGNMLESIIGHHQDFVSLNSKFVTFDTKNQLHTPLRQYALIVHDNIGANLNKLLETIGTIYKYSPDKLYVSSKNNKN